MVSFLTDNHTLHHGSYSVYEDIIVQLYPIFVRVRPETLYFARNTRLAFSMD